MFNTTGSGKLRPEDHNHESLDPSPRSGTDATYAHSLASIPAGLEVVPTNDKQIQHSEKEAVQAEPEAISQADKEVSNVWATSHGPFVPPQEQGIAIRRICGLRRRFFWGFVATLVVALAVIVGLGGGLGVRKSRAEASCDSGMC